MGAYPKVLEIFKIIIDFIWNVISLPINLGNGFQITIFHLLAFIFLTVTFLKMFQLQIPKFSAGWDSYGKFSTSRTNQIRKGK